MDTFDRTFNITEQFIRENPVYVSWDHENAIAFWGLKRDGGGWELEYFCISEQCLGKVLWKADVESSDGLVQTPEYPGVPFCHQSQAIGFYEKMGAKQDGMWRSSIDGRSIPHFVYNDKQPHPSKNINVENPA